MKLKTKPASHKSENTFRVSIFYKWNIKLVLETTGHAVEMCRFFSHTFLKHYLRVLLRCHMLLCHNYTKTVISELYGKIVFFFLYVKCITNLNLVSVSHVF